MNKALTIKSIPYASTILIELNKIDSDYYVNVSYNGVELILPANCQGERKCLYKNFIGLAKEKSYYSDLDGYREKCGISGEDL